MERFLLSVNGGPRVDGCSARMLRYFEQYAVQRGLSVRQYDAYRSGFLPCIDCRTCRKTEGCVFDDMDAFFADFEAAQAIVIASPIYNLSFPAPMKAIIDRMQRYYSARFFLEKKPPIVRKRPAALLLSAGDKGENGEVPIRQLKKIFTVTNCALIDTILCSGTDDWENKTVPDSLFEKRIEQCVAMLLDKID